MDSGTGNTFTISIVARESDDSTGSGKATLFIIGPSISLCSAHGPSAEIDFSAGGEDFGGNNPLQDIQCGTSYGMAVAIDGCTATTELHGYSHSDYSFIPYMGSIPLDFSFRKSAQPNTGVVNLKLYTPKGPIKLSGTMNGSITMDTCK